MGQAIGSQLARLLGRAFGPKVTAWMEAHGLPIWGIVLLLVFAGFAWGIWQFGDDEGQTPDEQRRNRRFGRWTAGVLLAIGVALLATTVTFGSAEQKVMQEVGWTLAAGLLGSVACVLLLRWFGPGWSARGRWVMRAFLLVPALLGGWLATLAAERPLPALSPADAKQAVSEFGGVATETDPKTGTPAAIRFAMNVRRSSGPDSPLRDDDLPRLLDALRVLPKLRTVDLSQTAVSANGAEQVRTALPGVTVVGPPNK